MVTTGTPSPEVDTIVKSFFVKVLSKKAPSPGLKQLLLKMLYALMLERNHNLSEDERQYVTRFFARIQTGRNHEMDILAYELLNVSVDSICYFSHRY